MDSNKIANWLQVAGSFGLLAGLLLVAVQINQATELTRFQIDNEWLTGWQQRQLSMMGEMPAEIWAKAIDNAEELTAAEILVAENYLQNYLDYWWTIKRFSNDGLVDDARWLEVSASGMTDGILGTQFGKAWWISLKETGGVYGDEEFDAEITKIVEGIDPSVMTQWHDLLRRNFKKVGESISVE